ncbi:hypothetical protein MKW98_029168 [Papaver atlanticum]|uniref:Uncharacterized protein n=1 Tax=Papaver atlanticum TaxID=357466 RepID=A0AAD4XQ35_9MAGN|nr:hypothetical protein MKW98_029168 [Papaver atlanticum]
MVFVTEFSWASYGKIIDKGYRIATRIHSHFPHTSRIMHSPKDALSAAARGTSSSNNNNNSGCGCEINNKTVGIGSECIILQSNNA